MGWLKALRETERGKAIVDGSTIVGALIAVLGVLKAVSSSATGTLADIGWWWYLVVGGVVVFVTAEWIRRREPSPALPPPLPVAAQPEPEAQRTPESIEAEIRQWLDRPLVILSRLPVPQGSKSFFVLLMHSPENPVDLLIALTPEPLRVELAGYMKFDDAQATVVASAPRSVLRDMISEIHGRLLSVPDLGYGFNGTTDPTKLQVSLTLDLLAEELTQRTFYMSINLARKAVSNVMVVMGAAYEEACEAQGIPIPPAMLG